MTDLPPGTGAVATADELQTSSSSELTPLEIGVSSPDYGGKIVHPTITYPSATEGQRLLLDGLNTDVLAIIVDFLFDIDELNGLFFSLYNNPRPYLRTHRSALNLSVVNKRLRSVCIGKLFKDIHRCSTSMNQLNLQLKDLELTLKIFSSIRTCEIVASSRHESTLCKTRLPKFLAVMPHLRKLSITHRKRVDFSALDVTLARASVVLPSVVGLRIECPGDWHFLVEACPNTEVLVLGDNLHCERMMEAASELEKLQHVEFYDKYWYEYDIELIYEFLPNIESLALKGAVDEGDVVEWADTFGQFSRLRNLALTTDSEQLDAVHMYALLDDDIDIAMSIIYSRRSNGGNIGLVNMALDYFEFISTLETLFLWEFCSPYCFSVTRNADGNPTAVKSSHSAKYDEFDRDSFYATLDRDDFPKMLSFPREILSYGEKYDPPTYGRKTAAEREEEKAWRQDRRWYTKRGSRWQEVD